MSGCAKWVRARQLAIAQPMRQPFRPPGRGHIRANPATQPRLPTQALLSPRRRDWYPCHTGQGQVNFGEMELETAVEREIRDLIHRYGRITFAQFMQTCLYSPHGGFYASRGETISSHFGTSSTSHPVFGALIARQLEQMWRLLDCPSTFDMIEVGSGDGSLANAIVNACQRRFPEFARAVRYVAVDYRPGLARSPGRPPFTPAGAAGSVSENRDEMARVIQRVRSDGLHGLRNITGCILSNELIDNFPVHRFVIQDGRVLEAFVTSTEGNLTEVLDEPSTPRIEQRLTELGLSLPEGYRGEVNLAIGDWTDQLARVLNRGYVLTIDYGGTASELYSSENSEGTLVCYNRHVAGNDPYVDVGQQDVTCHADFTSLMRLGERRGLSTLGYATQRKFLENLGFAGFLENLDTQGQSAARTELNRIAMMTLVDPAEYGDFKVLAQATGDVPPVELLGFRDSAA